MALTKVGAFFIFHKTKAKEVLDQIAIRIYSQ